MSVREIHEQDRSPDQGQALSEGAQRPRRNDADRLANVRLLVSLRVKLDPTQRRPDARPKPLLISQSSLENAHKRRGPRLRQGSILKPAGPPRAPFPIRIRRYTQFPEHDEPPMSLDRVRVVSLQIGFEKIINCCKGFREATSNRRSSKRRRPQMSLRCPLPNQGVNWYKLLKPKLLAS